MLRHILSLACSVKKEKRKLAIEAGPSEQTQINEKTENGELKSSSLDGTLNTSVAIQLEDNVINTSDLEAKVLSDASLESANLQNRATPIDFNTEEVKADEDIVHKNVSLPPPVKPRKFAQETFSPSPSSSSSSQIGSIERSGARASKSSTKSNKGKLHSMIGGSLRSIQAKKTNRVSFAGNVENQSLEKRISDHYFPKFGTALTSITSRTPSSDEKSPESGECESPNHRRFSHKECSRIYFSNTSSEQSSRSNSSTPRRIRQTTSSSGFGSMSHLPPIAYRKSLEPLNSLMSQSMYVQTPGFFLDERRSASSRQRTGYENSSETWIPSSPSLTTLKDFMMTNEDEMFEEDFDFDNEDVKSVVSSASTSRLFSVERKMSKIHKNQTLRQFLNSPVRLRKRGDASRRDAVEAGFEPRDPVPRCHSTQSLRDVQRVRAYSNSQFQASDLSLNPNGRVLAACDSTSANVVAPTAIVNPAQVPQHLHRQHHLHPSHSRHEQNGASQNYDMERRRSLQPLTNATSLYQMSNGEGSGVFASGRSRFSPSDLALNNNNNCSNLSAAPSVHNRSRLVSADIVTNTTPVHSRMGSAPRVASVDQLCESVKMTPPQYNIDQRRSVHNVGGVPFRTSFIDGIKNTSTPKNQVAVAPLAKSRHVIGSRDDMRTERRGSLGGQADLLPAYNSYVMNHGGEERLVDGPITNPSEARMAYLEKRIRELEMSQKEQNNQSTPNLSRESRHSSGKSSHISLSKSDQLRMQEMNDQLMNKDRKVTSLEMKLLKAYQRIERMTDDYERKVKQLIYDGERARDDLTRCVDKIQQLEHELDVTRASAQNGGHAVQQEYHELQDKFWKQERELQECRTMLNRNREKDAEFERMRAEKGYVEQKNDDLNKKLEVKKRAIEELERCVSTMRLEQSAYHQSCSSGSTPLADEMETMSDIRPSMIRPYSKAHSTLGSHSTPLSRSKSGGLTKSFSNFALNASKQDDITPMMSRTIREQNRHIVMCRAMVVCLKDTVERLARGDNPDVARLLGVKMNMSDSELDDDEDNEAAESKPFSMMSAESTLNKQCEKLSDLDKDLDTIRCQLAEWHEHTNFEGEGDRDVCRMQ
ncbi:unnamed protein product [Caenorhabditis sp. 36 PRJEB53466]|nr:unnamed protein product [Caenorhabditis sp. 36 PRJEB53466]